MTVTAVRKDPGALTMTLEAEFDASPERVWQLWADPRQLERWWGPPTYPATVTAHDLRPGGRVEYHMTGPSGDQPHGYWEVLEAVPPHRLVLRNGLANADGTPDSNMPLTEYLVTITEVSAARTSMSIESRFPDAAAMERYLAMGMEQGLTEAVGQIDGILVAPGGAQSDEPSAAPSGPIVTTHTLQVPGATLTYDVRSVAGNERPILLLIGSPMGASGFGTLVSHFTDRIVVTYDPRGAERSAKADPASPSTPEQHADDLHRIIQAIGGGPVDLFANSGGAVNALALVAEYPEDVRTLVAHEPPLAAFLPDRDAARAMTSAIHDTYQREGFGPAMAQFIATVSHTGPFTPEQASQPAPDPAQFGLPSADDGVRDDVLLSQNIIGTTHFEPNVDALRASSTRIVMAAGDESAGQMANRGAVTVAERLGTTAVIFPGGHGAFMGGEYGQPPGRPDEFAAKLRAVLAGD